MQNRNLMLLLDYRQTDNKLDISTHVMTSINIIVLTIMSVHVNLKFVHHNYNALQISFEELNE